MDFLRRVRRSETGQASVELVAALPFVLLVGALIWQCALAGHTAWLAAHAARAGARAEVVDGDVRAAVRSVLPEGLEHGLEVERRDGRLRAERFGTHEFRLDQIMDAYDVFADAGRHNALKVVLKA